MTLSTTYLTAGLLFIAGFLNLQAQESGLLLQYRAKVLDYNPDIRAAVHARQREAEQQKSAKADYLPEISADGNFNYTGNPQELTLHLPDSSQPVRFEGSHSQYGATLSVLQPVYQGGALRGAYDQACQQHQIAMQEVRRITRDVICEAETRYWHAVADVEMTRVAQSYHHSVSRLVEVARHRVEVEYADRNDLLMAEVKLNEAAYFVLRTGNQAEVSRLALNAFAGIAPDTQIPTDSLVCRPAADTLSVPDVDSLIEHRPERLIARHRTALEQASSRIANARYLPQIQIGFDARYSSPGYDFTHDMDPNYALYAKVSIPLFEWGKRRNTRNAGRHNISISRQNEQKTIDNLRLETTTAYYNYMQSIRQVELTGNSLKKAAESENMALDKYREGDISIIEVINTQIYLQQAETNYIQSKLNAQLSWSQLKRIVGETGN